MEVVVKDRSSLTFYNSLRSNWGKEGMHRTMYKRSQERQNRGSETEKQFTENAVEKKSGGGMLRRKVTKIWRNQILEKRSRNIAAKIAGYGNKIYW
jgi:hypothetical protein